MRVTLTTNTEFLDGCSAAVRLALPVRRECPPVLPPFAFGGQGHNCNLCATDEAFELPWKRGDVLRFAFQFEDLVNIDSTVQSLGWLENGEGYIDIKIFDCADPSTEILSGAASVSTMYYTFFCNATGLVQQVIFVDTSLFPEIECFSIQVTTYDDEGNEVNCVISEPYRLVGCDPAGGNEVRNVATVTVEGAYMRTDCARRCYDEPAQPGRNNYINYSNFLRIPGYFVYSGVAAKSTEVTDLGYIKKTVTNRTYRLTTLPIPSYAVDMLCVILESDNTIKIDGKQFDAGGVSFVSEQIGENTFCVTADFTLTCEINNVC